MIMCDITTKVCNKCGEEKPLTTEYFYRNNTSKLGFSITCKECYKLRQSKRSKLIHSGKIEIKKNHPKNKKCIKCNQIKDIQDFTKKITNKDGYRNTCKKCRKEYEDKWKKNNPLNVIKSKKKYRDKESSKLMSRNYHREYMRNKVENDVLFKLKCRISARLREAINRFGYTKRSRTYEYVGCDWETLKNHFENQFQDGMSWDNYGVNGWHIDHIIPLNSARTEEELYKLNHYTNLQPLWAEDNLRKSDKISEEWNNIGN